MSYSLIPGISTKLKQMNTVILFKNGFCGQRDKKWADKGRIWNKGKQWSVTVAWALVPASGGWGLSDSEPFTVPTFQN